MPKSNQQPTSGANSPRANSPLTGSQRLNKLLAAAGLGSRRDCEELILSGRVEVDGKTVTELATKVDSSSSEVKVDGAVLKRFRPVYYALNKPAGVLCTNRDPSGRTLVTDLLPATERVFSVGRLDRASEGLMLLTNDGELAQRLAHPKFGVQKIYFATVQGEITMEELAKLKTGVRLAEGYARVDGIKVRRQRKGCCELEIVLSEGKNREIRRILAKFGHKVLVLRRLAIGSLRLGTLPKGGSRQLTRQEVAALYACAHTSRKSRSKNKLPRREHQENLDEIPAPAQSLADFSGDDFLPTLSPDSKTFGSVLTYDGDVGPTSKPGGKHRPQRRLGPANHTPTPTTSLARTSKRSRTDRGTKVSPPVSSSHSSRSARGKKSSSKQRTGTPVGRARRQKRR